VDSLSDTAASSILFQTTQLAKIAAVQTATFGRTEIIFIKPESKPHVAIMEFACPPSNPHLK
jgi:hypothetical protein